MDTVPVDEANVSAPLPKRNAVAPQRSLSASEMMSALGTSPRRIFLSGISASTIALAGNLFGITSQLLMIFPEDQVAATGLDTYFPRGPYKRYRTADYSLVIPKEWVADTAVELAKVQRRSMSLDYSMRTKSNAVLPDAAFGPPGNLLNSDSAAGDTNVSIIKTPAPAQFDLRQVMTPNQSDDPASGVQFLLQNFLAGKGRQVTLLSVSGDNASDRSSSSFRFSYRVDRGESRAPLQAISIIAQKYASSDGASSAVAAGGGGELFTFTVVAPVSTWGSDYASKLEKVADSFRLE